MKEYKDFKKIYKCEKSGSFPILESQLIDRGLTDFVAEIDFFDNFLFIPDKKNPFGKLIKRKWRSDYAFPTKKIIIELEGGAHSDGRHTRGTGFMNDMEKYNWITLTGWSLLRFVPKDITTGYAIEMIEFHYKQKKIIDFDGCDIKPLQLISYKNCETRASTIRNEKVSILNNIDKKEFLYKFLRKK